MNDEERRILSYLQAQGAKLSPVEVIDKVRVAMAQLRAAAATIPAARFAERPAPEEWSANEVLAHVVAAGASVGDGIIRILDGLPAGEPPADRRPEAPPRRSAEEWCAELERDRDRLFARVRSADPTARLEATVEHGTFGRLNWRELLLFLRLHDLDHAGQIQKIAGALGGPRPA